MIIYKYPLQLKDEQTILLPAGSEVLHVGNDANNMRSVWVLLDEELPSSQWVVYTFWIIGTGNPMPSQFTDNDPTTNTINFVSTIVEPPFVWHVFYQEGVFNG